MPRIYRPTGPTDNKSDGPTESKNSASAQEPKITKNAGKKDSSAGDK